MKVRELTYGNSDYTRIAVNFSDVPDEILDAVQRRAWRQSYLNPRRVARILPDCPNPWFVLRMYLLRLGKGLLTRTSV